MNASQAVSEMKNILKSNGFEDAGIVTDEEHEDGVGAGVGQNWWKSGVLYTEAQAMRECGKGIALFNKRGEQREVFKTSRAVYSSSKFHAEQGHTFSFEIVDL